VSLVFTPTAEAVAELKREWAWLLPAEYEPVLFSALGDLFYEVPAGSIWWLNTGTAELSKVAENTAAFEGLLNSEESKYWFLPALIEELAQAGKTLGEGQCYSFVTLPIFKQASYSVDNLNPVDAKEHFGLTGCVHRQICDLPEGAAVRFEIT